MDDKEEHPEKHQPAIIFTNFGISIDFNDEHS
jgi:hypothetical protein